MKSYLCFTVAALGLIATPLVVEARGGGYGGHFQGGGWHGGGFTHHNYHYKNHYYGGWGGYWYGPGYYTGGPVGYYNTPVRCKWVHTGNGPNRCHWRKLYRR